jgi:mRNA-degrading endonuclease YafQ of YafQ-DinJ toxin-antitoxin module
MAKWKVHITDEASKVFQSKALTSDDKIVIQQWAELVRDHGPEVLTKRQGMWADDALYGEWRGHRASSFSNSGRIIYTIEEHIVTVAVVRITTTHDYRRKK